MHITPESSLPFPQRGQAPFLEDAAVAVSRYHMAGHICDAKGNDYPAYYHFNHIGLLTCHLTHPFHNVPLSNFRERAASCP